MIQNHGAHGALSRSRENFRRLQPQTVDFQPHLQIAFSLTSSNNRYRTFRPYFCVCGGAMPFMRRYSTSWPYWSAMCQTATTEMPSFVSGPA